MRRGSEYICAKQDELWLIDNYKKRSLSSGMVSFNLNDYIQIPIKNRRLIFVGRLLYNLYTFEFEMVMQCMYSFLVAALLNTLKSSLDNTASLLFRTKICSCRIFSIKNDTRLQYDVLAQYLKPFSNYSHI